LIVFNKGLFSTFYFILEDIDRAFRGFSGMESHDEAAKGRIAASITV
jgi:hypothetical protein